MRVFRTRVGYCVLGTTVGYCVLGTTVGYWVLRATVGYCVLRATAARGDGLSRRTDADCGGHILGVIPPPNRRDLSLRVAGGTIECAQRWRLGERGRGVLVDWAREGKRDAFSELIARRASPARPR
jgi:hypothetical protein